MTNPETLRTYIDSAVKDFDRRSSRGKYYNVYALGQYLEASERCAQLMADGVSLDRALTTCFQDRLLTAVRKALAKRGVAC